MKITFKLVHGKYISDHDGSEITVDQILKNDHEIEEDHGWIDIINPSLLDLYKSCQKLVHGLDSYPYIISGPDVDQLKQLALKWSMGFEHIRNGLVQEMTKDMDRM